MCALSQTKTTMTVEPERLSSDEFAKALHEGRGRALMHVLAHGLDGVEQHVLNACIEEQAYDPQCEGHRAAWLYRMFKDAPQYGLFRRRIVAALRDCDEDRSAEQLCELACLMAHDGDDDAHEALQSFFWSQSFDDDDWAFSMTGCHAIVSIDGFAALRDIVQWYGRFLLKNPDQFVDSLDDMVDDPATRSAMFATLVELARTDMDIAAFVDYEQRERARRHANQQQSPEQQQARDDRTRADVLARFPLDQILAAAARHDPSRGNFFRFGRWCSEDARVAVLERLSTETDVETCLRLLWVFRRAAPPYIPERLWALALHGDGRIRDAALTALAQADDRSVGEFGRKYLAQGIVSVDDAAAIELLTKHYLSGDELLIMAALHRLDPDADYAHSIGMSILAFTEVNNSAATAGILTWMVDTNPCTICRGTAIERLIASHSLPSAIALECAFDAEPDNQNLVNNYKAN